MTIDYGPSYYAREWAQRVTEEQADIIIARGLQAVYIKQSTTIPLVEVRLTGQEMGLLVNKAKALLQKPRPQIAVIGYKNQYCKEFFSEYMEIGSVEVIANLSPIQIDGHIAGAIFSAQEFSRLETMGNKARQMQFVGQLEDNVRLKDIEEPSRAMRAAVETAAVYAKSDAPVLITAAPGTDARRLGRAIHNETKTTNFVMIDCAALEKENQVQMLFGSGEKDSGLISSARGGTLYLANIEKLSSPCQQRLLRMLQENVLLSADGRSTYANIRVIASCGEGLPEAAAAGRFSQLLYYALNTLPLALPALHARPEDIAYWTEIFLKRYRKQYKRYIQLTAGGMQQMTKFAWEGGLIQLDAFCQHLVLTIHHRSVDENAVRRLYLSVYPLLLPGRHAAAKKETLKETNHESDAIIASLQRHQGNRGETAAELGISPTTLWRKMKKYGIQNIFEES